MKIEEVKKMVLENALHREVTAEDIAENERLDFLSVNQGRDGREYVWYMDSTTNIAADAETGEELTENEIEELFA